MVRTLHGGDFIDGAHNVVLIGGPGTGKTHVATALGVQAVEHHRKKVRFFATVDLVNALEQEKALNKAGQLADRLLRLDLIILDELGYLPFSTSGGALLFHLLSQALRAHQRRHHHQSQLQRVGWHLWRCQDDHRVARPPHPPLPHPGDRKRQLPLPGQCRSWETKKEPHRELTRPVR